MNIWKRKRKTKKKWNGIGQTGEKYFRAFGFFFSSVALDHFLFCTVIYIRLYVECLCVRPSCVSVCVRKWAYVQLILKHHQRTSNISMCFHNPICTHHHHIIAQSVIFFLEYFFIDFWKWKNLSDIMNVMDTRDVTEWILVSLYRYIVIITIEWVTQRIAYPKTRTRIYKEECGYRKRYR